MVFLYFIYLLVLILIIFYLIFKYKYKFWILQPVFHLYDFHYYLTKPQIINYSLPELNKYVDFFHIKFYSIDEHLDKNLLHKSLFLIQNNYYRNNQNIYLPHIKNFYPYFLGHNTFSFLSVYYSSKLYKNHKEIIEHQYPIGVMTSRPLEIFFKSKRIMAYYVDYLCVEKSYRKKGIAPKIIQTHEYAQRHKNPNIQVSLFKREGELTGIVPLCVYKTNCYYLANLFEEKIIHPSIQIIAVDKQNFNYLVSFIKETDHFECKILPHFANLLHLIESKNVKIYISLQNNEIESAFFYRRTCCYYKGKEIVSLFASIKSNLISASTFVSYFNKTINLLSKHFYYLAIEQISDNIILTKYYQNEDVLSSSPTAYFLYNYIQPTIKSSNVLLLN